ncbi:NAD(P)-dependent oxidoreductase [Brevibacillus panacihumi]|uniref:SDR family oxidoreductase n=1 Tax=Brevibacillus panacihumi TaxID=497735 RepID=A0A3M8CM16_9BACL|nr:SDR family oxidoreductase [Brevibacillus panacihumi]RNB76668.1 SDR family oxidoreductase [Brevibacillus panacihumi]
MNLLILGATGRVGSEVLRHALRDGHQVTAFVRNPDKLAVTDQDRLMVAVGNVLNAADVETAMQGAEVVVSALSTDGTDTLSQGMPLVIAAMKKTGVSRIVTVGTAGILQSRVSPDLLRYQSSESKRTLTRAAQEHHQVYTLLEQSGLDWTIVCPTYLPDGERLGSYRVEAHYLPENGTQISVADTADCVYRQVFSREHLHTRLGIAY